MRKKDGVRKLSTTRGYNNLSGYLMIAPNLISFCTFTLFGVAFSLCMAFTDWDMIRGINTAKFIGLKNFIGMWKDTYVTKSLRNNMLLLIEVPIELFLAMVLAAVMNRGIYGKAGVRALFFLPYVTNTVAISVVWKALFHPSKGPVNLALRAIGIQNLPGWLSSSDWALPAVMIILLWKSLGYDILIYSGALQSVPEDLYEAADLDGAGPIVKFFKITLPHIQPTTFLLTILGVINSLTIWSFMQIVTDGGPGFATYTMGLYIYRNAFKSTQAGYACALSWVLTIIVLIFTLVRTRYEKRYSAE